MQMQTMSAIVEARKGRRYDGLILHGLIVLFIIAAQFVYTPAQDLEPDNTWHYRFAREILTGENIYWAGIDANRLFPDLIFALIAYVASGGAAFEQWAPYFYVVLFLAIYLSLIGLAATLFEDALERRAFLLISMVGLWAFEIGSPFWARHIFDPGNHGTGLPVAFGCLALLFWMINNRRFNAPVAAGLVLAGSLLVGANRFLLIGFILPLLAALFLLFASRWVARPAGQRGVRSVLSDHDLRLLLLLLCTVVAAGLGGLLAYKVFGSLNWHKAVTQHSTQTLENPSASWLAQQFKRELQDFQQYYSYRTKHLVVGPALMLWTIPVSVILLRSLRAVPHPGMSGNQAVFGLVAATASILAVLFLVFGWSSYGDWRYRFFAMPLAYAVVLVCMLLVRPWVDSARGPALAAGTLAAMLGLTVHFSLERQPQEAVINNQFHRDVEGLKQVLAKHGATKPWRGLSEYWLAIDVTARTDLPVDVVQPRTMLFGAYNNSVGHLCRGGYSLVLRPHERDPKRDAIIAALGEPRATENVEIEGPGKVEVLIYEPAVLEARFTQPSKDLVARAIFPNFRCRS